MFNKRDFWLQANLRYSQPHFRLEKCASIVNALSQNQSCDLLDIGCGPATLARLLQKNITYYGIDIAIHEPAPNLLELDIAQNDIKFGKKSFDIVVATGLFEYLGGLQREKFAEIQRILNKHGKFVVTYLNFSHINDRLCDDSVYNNIQTIKVFRKDLELFFDLERWFSSSFNWHRSQPRRTFLRKIQMPLNMTIPIIGPLLTVDYFFICSLKTR